MLETEFFFALTPERVLSAADESGYATTGHCFPLNSLENRVYDLKLEDHSHVVAKFYRPGRWNLDQIQEEHDFLFDLVEEEIPVCAPLRFADGLTIHETAGIHFALWPRTGGRAPDELNDESLLSLGRMLARIHNVGEKRKAPNRIVFSAEQMAQRSLEFLEANDLLPKHIAQRYREAALSTIEVYNSLAANIPLHRIHGDAHLGNLLHGKDGWFFLDFDDFCTGPAVQDVWLLTPARDDDGLRQREVFLQGYRQFREFDDSWCKLIEPLRALRYIHYSCWIARRYEDPAFPIAFPHFKSNDYWENATVDLEEQVDLFAKETPQAFSVTPKKEESEPELTNKDFFFDWEEK